MAEYIIKTAQNEWEVVVGLEIHCQIISKSKIFSGASTEFGDDPNVNVSFVDAGMPGMLPVLNKECVHQANVAVNVRNVQRAWRYVEDLRKGARQIGLGRPVAGFILRHAHVGGLLREPDRSAEILLRHAPKIADKANALTDCHMDSPLS